MRGAERIRLNRDSATRDQWKRIHFYVNEGSGVSAETGVGYHAHAVNLNNLYDWTSDKLGLWDQAAQVYKDHADMANWVEQYVIVHGFDGIYARNAQGNQGVAVLIGEHVVPVDYLGMGKKETAVAKAPEIMETTSRLKPSKLTSADKIKWRALKDVKNEIGLDHLPAHIEPFGDFMRYMADKAAVGAISPRDLIKAYTITRSSVNRSAVKTEKVKLFGLRLPQGFNEPTVRPEGAFSYWLLSEQGQAYLNDAENGKVNEEAIQNAVKVMQPFGMANTLGEDMRRVAGMKIDEMAPEISKLVADASLGKNVVRNWQSAIDSLHGIGYAKKGFMGALLGYGQLPTFDARQINVQVKPDSKDDVLNALGTKRAPEVVAKLSRRLDALDLTMDPIYAPFKQHLVHHAVWDAVGKSETTHADVVDAMMNASERRDWYYSQLETAVSQIPAKLKTGNEIALWLQSNAGKLQVKKEELEWSGVLDWLKAQKQVSKEEVRSWLAENGVRVEEVILGENVGDPTWFVKSGSTVVERGFATKEEAQDWADENAPYHGEYTVHQNDEPTGDVPKHADGNLVLPGGTDHREIVLTVPTIEPYNESDTIHYGDTGKGKAIAWMRVNTRTDADGNKVLFVEEIQSQRNQHGRTKGFETFEYGASKDYTDYVKTLKERAIEKIASDFENSGLAQEAARKQAEKFVATIVKNGDERMTTAAELSAILDESDKHRDLWKAKVTQEEINKGKVPSAPFVSTRDGKPTDSYIPLTLKRLIAYAVDTGHDAIAWTTGDQQADRYDLSKQIKEIEYEKQPDGRFHVIAITTRGDSRLGDLYREDQLPDIVGKDIADKIIAGEGDGSEGNGYKSLTGVDLKVGGGWTQSMYGDSTGSNAQGKPSMISAAAKKLGAEVGGVEVQDGSPAQFNPDTGEKDLYDYMQQPGFQITPAMREQVQGHGMPLFSESRDIREATSRIVGDSGRPYDQAQQALFTRIGRRVDDLSTWEKLKQWFDKKWVQGIFDQFAPIKELGGNAYTLTRLSKGSTGAFEAFMRHGKLSLRDETYDADTSGGVIENVFAPIGKESTDFLTWVAGNRAERLAMQGKERLFTAADIQAAKSLADGTLDFDYTLSNGTTTRDRQAAYKDTLKKFNEYNKNILDMAEQSGLIDGASRHLWEHEFYVPFYRVADDKDGGVRGMNIKQGLVRQQAFKKLKGGTEQLNDLLQNTLMNWAHLIDASAKNRAAKATIDSAVNLGVAHQATYGEKETVWYVDGGKKKEFKVDSPELMVALQGLEFSGLRGPIMDFLQAPKHWLTVGVTSSPFFKVRNLIRDSLQAVATSDLSYNIPGNLIEGFKLTDRASQEYVSALAGGGLIRFGSMLEGNEASRTRKLIRQSGGEANIINNETTWEKFKAKVLPALDAYEELGNRGEEINRMALYDQLIKKGMSHAEASLMARDLMDFSLQGSFNTVRFLSQVVPFFNARMQGLYKLGRASKEHRAQMATMAFATSLFGLALLGMYGDDDDWKKREEWDRDGYWWFKFGGIAYRIPKPFELGAVATLAERTFETAFMTGDWKRYGKSILKLLGDQLSMNPIPQAIKPIVDLYANRDSFTERPIEGMGMQRLDPTHRYNSNTWLPARAMSEAIGGWLSPVQIEHLARGYFSWLGATSIGTADMLHRAMSNEPTKPALDYFKFATGGMVSELDSAGSRYVSWVYDQAKELEQAHATYRKLIKDGKLDEAREYATDNQDKLNRYRSVESVKKKMSLMSEQIRMIERSDKDEDKKRAEINYLRRQQDKLARQLAPEGT